jgi:hypothetical protein
MCVKTRLAQLHDSCLFYGLDAVGRPYGCRSTRCPTLPNSPAEPRACLLSARVLPLLLHAAHITRISCTHSCLL